MGSQFLLQEDLGTKPILFEDACLLVPHGRGLGGDLDDDKAELGEIVAGEKVGRTQPEEITIFDATGVSFQDLVTAKLAYERAVEAGLGTEFVLE